MAARLLHIDRVSPARTSGDASQAMQNRLALDLDVGGLAAELKRSVSGEVRFDPGSRALYATDGSNYRQVPIGVVLPRSADDIVRTVDIARRYGAPILARGGGTSLAGQCCNYAVVLDCSKYLHHLVELNPAQKRARVQPGLVLDDLRRAAEREHLTFGPDPSTHTHCTLGGMIGNNSCGVHSVMAGETCDNIYGLEVLTYDGVRLQVGRTTDQEYERITSAGGRRGDIYRRLRALRDRYAGEIRRRFPKLPRRVSGYNLPALLPEHGFDVARALVGSECTCVTILEATVRLVDSPPARSLLVLGYPDVYEAGDHVREILQCRPIGLEGLDEDLVDDMAKMRIHPGDIRLLPPGRGWLLAEFGGPTKAEADERARACMAALQRQPHPPSMKLFDNPSQEDILWRVRESGLGATAHVPGERVTWEGWEDSAVPVDRLGDYLRALRALFTRYDYACALYGHFGQGCVHTRIDFDLETRDGIAKFRSFLSDAADLVLSFGGSLSGEHGDGQSRAELLPKMFGDELMQAFREFKSIWDPEWKMNPGKIVTPYRVDENLRLGADYRPPALPTHFQFPADGYSFAQASLRCVGVGECRREEGRTMCPSYRITREEMHSTRGRARLLFEMLEGEPLTGGWRDPHVKEALDLCLACKGCKGDCPVNVDMATYKAEFLSHYYEGRLRPRHAYSMGLIYWWARLAAWFPRAANVLTQTAGLRRLVQWLGGIAQRRRMPPFATRPFTDWFRARSSVPRGGRPVLLFPDTFNNYFLPHTARAATLVLERLGYEVHIPASPLCCGRPLYDFGMLQLAQRQLRQILDHLQQEIRAGTPILVLEPSCAAVFRDELVNLFPHDHDAMRLSRQVCTFAELLDRHPPARPLPRWDGQAIVHGHCHQKAVMGMRADENILRALGVKHRLLDSGCCGMAGSFGFTSDHDGASRQIGELVLLPAVRAAAADTVILADGFSCRQQIEQATDRRALHLAEVMHLAMLSEGPGVPSRNGHVEQAYLARMAARPSRHAALMLIGGAVLAAAAISVVGLGARRTGRNAAGGRAAAPLP